MSFSHINSPACKMLGVRCCCCNIPLVDGLSIELGIGPICRKNHGYDVTVDEAARTEANKLVHMIAEKRLGDAVEAATDCIEELGFMVLAARIRGRLTKAAKNAKKIVIKIDGSRLILTTPYRRGAAEEFKTAMRNIPGRKWDGKVNSFPSSSKRAVWAFLMDFFPGQYGTGPKGVFEIPKAKAA